MLQKFHLTLMKGDKVVEAREERPYFGLFVHFRQQNRSIFDLLNRVVSYCSDMTYALNIRTKNWSCKKCVKEITDKIP